MLNARDVDQKVDVLTRYMVNILDNTMPEKKVRMHPNHKPWLSLQIKSAIMDRQRAYSKGDMEKYHATTPNKCIIIDF